MTPARSAARGTQIPPVAWGQWGLALIGLALMATPYRQYAYWPLAVAFFVMFGSFVGGRGDKGLLRYRALATGQLLAVSAAMAVAVTLAPWGNLWHVGMMVSMAVGVNWRQLLFEAVGYNKYWWIDVMFLSTGVVLYVVSGLAAPEGVVGWLAMAPWLLFVFVGFRMLTKRQLDMMAAMRRAVGVGDAAPDFSLESHRGEKVTLSDYRGERLVMLFFVRGDWCPGCHIMLRVYERNRHRFMDSNTAVLAIGPDPTGVNRAMAETLRLEYGVLYDEGLAVAKAYGVLLDGPQPGGNYDKGMPTPTAFLIDKEGVIRFSSKPDQSGILNPEAIFPVMESLAC